MVPEAASEIMIPRIPIKYIEMPTILSCSPADVEFDNSFWTDPADVVATPHTIASKPRMIGFLEARNLGVPFPSSLDTT